MKSNKKYLVVAFLMMIAIGSTQALNPIISDQFTADPTARIFGIKVYLYPSHDIFATEERGRVGWFCMEDYHVFSSSILNDWKDQDVIPSQNKGNPFVSERIGIYYLAYPHVLNETECLEYDTGISPLEPFKVAGIIMDESSNCWTNHQSIIFYKDQWYLFYHNNDLSPKFDKNRSVRIGSMFFNDDGTIQKVTPALRGVGLTNALEKIQLNRYSQINNKGTTIAFLDTLNTFGGLKTTLEAKNARVIYNGMDFGKKNLKKVNVRSRSKNGVTLLLQINNASGPIIAKVSIPSGEALNIIEASMSKFYPGVQNIVV